MSENVRRYGITGYEIRVVESSSPVAAAAAITAAAGTAASKATAAITATAAKVATWLTIHPTKISEVYIQ